MNQKNILDHGYLKLVDCWGRDGIESAVGDEAIIAAARETSTAAFVVCKRLKKELDKKP